MRFKKGDVIRHFKREMLTKQNASGRDGRRGRQQKKRMETGTGRHMVNCTINF